MSDIPSVDVTLNKDIEFEVADWQREAIQAFVSDDYQLHLYAGGRECFAKDTMIHTPLGLVKIQDIKTGDKVYSVKDGKKIIKKVLGLVKTKNTKKTIKLTLLDGSTIICTDDHKFFYKGKYRKIKDILGEDSRLSKIFSK